MKRPQLTRERLIAAVNGATSIRQVLIRLDVAPYGGNYGVLRPRIEPTQHRHVAVHWPSLEQGTEHSARKSLATYLDNTAPIQSYKLKRRLLRERLLEHRCVGCGLTEWQAVPIPLELDHINGDNQDNRLENLRLLCPNCHALTPTYRSKRRIGA